MAKLQDLADAFGKLEGDFSVVDHTTHRSGSDPIRSTSIMRGGTTLGMLTETSAGRWAFSAPDDAKFNDVAPLVAALDAENIKVGLPE